MEIKIPINVRSQIALDQVKNGPLDLRVGQIADAKVLEVKQENQTLMLELANKTLHLQSNQPLALVNGDKLKLEVMRLNPSPEFKVVNPQSAGIRLPLLPSGQLQADYILLKVPASPVEAQGAGSNRPITPDPLLTIKEPLTAKVVAVSKHRVQLELQSEVVEPKSKVLVHIDLDRTTTASLKLGQMVILKPVQSGSVTEYRLLNPAVKISELFKQYLPVHESPVQFIEQLVKNITALEQNQSVPATLKRLAQEIIQNLPRQHQLTQSSFIKQAISQSGLFLEAKLAVAEETASPLSGNDFKAQLLKFAEILKHETIPKMDVNSAQAETEQLKTLLQKTESGIAKIILDQLASLPKQEITQQLWHLEIPYMDKNKAESVKIDIERDTQNNESSHNSAWSVTITITPPNLGTLHCKVSYLDGTINTHFWSPQPQVTNLIKQNLDILRRKLEETGLKTGRMDALESEPAQEKFKGHYEEKLLDEKV